jgi:translation initiation factor 2 subunit 2
VPEPAAGEDLDFSDLKKKKKKTAKKAALDMEAFEKELHQNKVREGDEEEEVEPRPMEDYDEGELGDDVFGGGAAAAGEAPSGVDAGNEPWLTSDRDYLYPEVRAPTRLALVMVADTR